MTYRHSDHRDDYAPREHRYVDDHREHKRQDPYFDNGADYPDAQYVEFDHPPGRDNTDSRLEPTWQENEYSDGGTADHHYRDDVELSAERARDSYREDPYFDTEDERGFNRLDESRVDPLMPDSSNQKPNDGILINDADLRDVERAGGFPAMGKAFAKIAAVCCFALVIALAFFSTRQEISAYDIVSMEEYQGLQKPDWALEPKQMEECDSLSGCFNEEIAQKEPTPEQTTFQQATYQEIAASDRASSALTEVETESITTTTMRVGRQWSNLRTAPSMSGNIITAIANNTEVEIVGKENNWYEVIMLDASGTRGYMHQSTLQ